MLWKRSVWQYKFRKISYWFSACISYTSIYVSIRFERLLHPVVGILLAEHLGDIVAAEPIIDALRQKHPNAKIVWIVKDMYKGLLLNHPQIDRVEIETSLMSSIFLSNNPPFTHFYNLHLNELRFDPYFKRTLVNPTAEKIGLNLTNYYSKGNLLKSFYDLCHIPYNESKQPHLYLENEVTVELPKNYWVIHRKSNGIDREWQDEHWARLIHNSIDAYGITIVEVGVSNGLDINHVNFISLVGKTNIPEMAKIIAGANFFIGIDSGPSHIANAFEIPGLILLGDFKNFRNHMPYSGAYEKNRSTVYHYPHGPSAQIPLETVWQLLNNLKPIPVKKLA